MNLFSQSDVMSAQLIQSEEIRPQPAQPDMMTAEKIPRLNEKLTHSVVMPEKQPDKRNSEHGQAQTPQADQLSSAEDSQTKISHPVICQTQPKLEQCEKQLNRSLKHNIHRFIQTKRKQEDLEQLSPAKLRRMTSTSTLTSNLRNKFSISPNSN